MYIWKDWKDSTENANEILVVKYIRSKDVYASVISKRMYEEWVIRCESDYIRYVQIPLSGHSVRFIESPASNNRALFVQYNRLTIKQ
jgi:glycine betaine/choline ABC-type transport system substrate-binding protein